MATAALSQGVAAYVGPLWKISDMDAKNIAAAFYEALLIRRTSLGEALALARRSVREGVPDLDELVTRPAAGNWFRSGSRGRAQYGLGRHGSLRGPDADDPAAAQSAGRQGPGPEDAVIGTKTPAEYIFQRRTLITHDRVDDASTKGRTMILKQFYLNCLAHASYLDRRRADAHGRCRRSAA